MDTGQAHPTRQKEYEDLLVKALAIAALQVAGGGRAAAQALADRWIEQATEAYAAELLRKSAKSVPCGHC